MPDIIQLHISSIVGHTGDNCYTRLPGEAPNIALLVIFCCHIRHGQQKVQICYSSEGGGRAEFPDCLDASTLSKVSSGTLIPQVSISATTAMAASISSRSRHNRTTSSYSGLNKAQRKRKKCISHATPQQHCLSKTQNYREHNNNKNKKNNQNLTFQTYNLDCVLFAILV